MAIQADIILLSIYREMANDLSSARLRVVLVPMRDPPNRGGCLRQASESNCQWYRDLCNDFESARKQKYRNFKTKVKRRDITRILGRLASGKPCVSQYAEWIRAYAEARYHEYSNQERSKDDCPPF